MPPCTARHMLVVFGLFGHLTLPSGLSGQDVVTPGAPAFAVLEGAWEGTGTLFGRPATFRMRWEAAGDGFVHLAFSNGLVAEGGEVAPVLTSRAVYRMDGASALGVWLDSRPRRIMLEAALTDSSVVTRWSGEAEQGTTEYLIRSPDRIEVRDYVVVNGSARLFGEASYRRRTGPAPR